MFKNYLEGNAPTGDLESELKKFVGQQAYLKLIARATGLKPFDYNVAEALWIGNHLLERVSASALKRMILTRFTGKGMLSQKRALELAENFPAHAVPHHSFHVFFVGSITGTVKTTPRFFDECRPAWGVVTKVFGRKAQVVYHPVLVKKSVLYFGGKKTKRISLEKHGINLVPGLRAGDLVSFHWSFAAKELSHDEADRLDHYTQKNMDAVNEARR